MRTGSGTRDKPNDTSPRSSRSAEEDQLWRADNLNTPEILDTFPRFLQFWERARALNLSDRIEAWASDYLAPYPDLLEMQLADYREQGFSWQEIAAQRIFPHLEDRLPLMAEAHENLGDLLPGLYYQTAEALGFSFPVKFVIYVGIGCGAGWAAAYRGSPAVLFGLENIAELGWSTPQILSGLVVHELCHLAHHNWRREAGLTLGSGPWWQLYEEGFAQACEVRITGTWHETEGTSSRNWLEACQEKQPALAAEFLRRVDLDLDTREFFGSWYEVAGIPQAGYYLGSEILTSQIAKSGAEQTALLEDLEAVLRPALEAMATAS